MKKGKMFKKSISCLLAALMIIASMPFSALSASAAESKTVSKNYHGALVYNLTTGQYNTPRAKSSEKKINVVNDGQKENFDIGFVSFDVSSLNGKYISSANYSFTVSSSANNENLGLSVYYPQGNYAEAFQTSSGEVAASGKSMAGAFNVTEATSAGNTAPFIAKAVDYFKFKKLKDIVLSEDRPKLTAAVNKQYTVDISEAIQYALDNNYSYATVCFMNKRNGNYRDNDGWSDTGVTVSDNFTCSVYDNVLDAAKQRLNDFSYEGNMELDYASYSSSFESQSDWATNEFYNKYEKNMLWGEKLSTYEISNADSWTNNYRMWIKYPQTVLLYDGKTNIDTPIVLQVAATSNNANRYIDWADVANNGSGFSLTRTRWNGTDGRANWLWLYSKNNQTGSGGTGTRNSSVRSQIINSTYNAHANMLRFSGTFSSTEYMKQIQPIISTYIVQSNNSAVGTFSNRSGNPIYIINYSAILGKINQAKSDMASMNYDRYMEDSVNAYTKAALALAEFDPSSLVNDLSGTNSSNIASKVNTAALKIKNLVDDYNNKKKELLYKYTFVKADNGGTVTVGAKNLTAALAQPPENTPSRYEYNNSADSDQHTHITYTWPTTESTDHVITEQKTSVTDYHDFNDKKICTCGYEPDFSAYDNAAGVEFHNISENSKLYDEDSFSKYEAAVRSAASNRNSVHSQTEIDNITFEILYAKTKLKKKTGTVTLMVYDANGNLVSDAGDTFNGNYGDTVTVKPKSTCNIVKWVIETNTAKKELVGELPSIDLVVNGDTTVKAYCDNSATDTENSYTKVIFKGSNGKVSAIKYVKDGDTLKTDTVEKPSLALYTIGEWNVSEVVGSADNAEVTVIAPCEPNTSYQCGIHFAGLGDKVINKPYDTRIDINDYIQNDNVTYALATDDKGQNIIAYIDGTVFYVPARADVYVVKKSVGTKKTMINTVGVYTTKRGTGENAKKTIGFNCKFSLAEGCQALEWGVVFIPIYNKAGGGTKIGTSTVAPIRSLSAQNEYTARINIPATSTSYNSIKAKAYLKYRDEAGEHVIYGNENTQAFDTNTKFWEVK